MKNTTNYSLLLPDEDDFYSVKDMNANTEIIDAQMKNNKNAIDTVNKKILGVNHLHNWDFRNVVNSAGIKTYNYDAANTKVIERWKSLNGLTTAIVAPSKLTLTSAVDTTGAWLLEQYVADASKFPDKMVTFSVVYAEKTGGNIQLLIIDSEGTAYGEPLSSSSGVAKVTKTIPNNNSVLRCVIAKSNANSDFSCDIYAAKLEIGDEATISGVPPVNYAEQALICRVVDIDGNYIGGWDSII